MLSTVTPSRLRQTVDYDHKTGNLTWRARSGDDRFTKSWNTRYAGKEAFSRLDKDGYKHGAIGGVMLQSHRVAWAIYHGEWPNGIIDHVDGDKANNCIVNLRISDRVNNARNARKSRANTSGYTGVRRIRRNGKWAATITVAGKLISLGHYDCIVGAIAARKCAEMRFGFSLNHGRG